MTLKNLAGICSMLLFTLTLTAGAASDKDRAFDWCLKKWVETAQRLNPVYQPTPQQVKEGQEKFMKECMANQGY